MRQREGPLERRTTICASVGVNGAANLVGHDDIEGSFTAYQGLGGVGSASVRDDVRTVGDVRGVGALSVGHDLSVGGSYAFQATNCTAIEATPTIRRSSEASPVSTARRAWSSVTRKGVTPRKRSTATSACPGPRVIAKLCA